MSSWFSWKRNAGGRSGPADAMRESNLQLACSIRRLQLTRAKSEERIRALEASIADLEQPANIRFVQRRKQARYGLRAAQHRLDVICEKIAATEARRDRNEDIGTMMEMQASTTSAIKGLQDTAPEIFSGSMDAVRDMALSDQQLQKYEETMNVALEMMNGAEDTSASLRAEADEDELRFMQQCELNMIVSLPETRIRMPNDARHAVPAAAAAKPDEDGRDQKHS